MICINCSANTQVVNSRPHKKTLSVWRRRQCRACGTTFTTMESIADSAYLFRVAKADKKPSEFSLPHLMLSIVPVLSHRDPESIADEAYWLAQTVAQDIQATASGAISAKALAHTTYRVVSLFDAMAGIQYGARHGIVQNSAQKPRRGRPRTTHQKM